MLDDRLSGPKPDALPGCATPRLAVRLGKAAIERNPISAFRGNEWRNEARTGRVSPGYIPNHVAGMFSPTTDAGCV